MVYSSFDGVKKAGKIEGWEGKKLKAHS